MKLCQVFLLFLSPAVDFLFLCPVTFFFFGDHAFPMRRTHVPYGEQVERL